MSFNNEPIPYALWPDGSWCEMSDLQANLVWKSDDYQIVDVTEWDDDGEPLFPGGLQ